MRSATRHATWHLDASQLLPAQNRCPICLAEVSRKPVCALQREPDLFFLECPRCRGCAASQMPKPEVLRKYYEIYYDEKKFGVTIGKRAKILARNIIRELSTVKNRPVLRILDLGGGDGTVSHLIGLGFVSTSLYSKVEITVVDEFIPLTTHDPRISIANKEDLSDVTGQFDLLMASAVAEHIPHLNGALQSLFSRASPGAIFYARTPYLVPIAITLENVDLGYLGHVHGLGAPFWNRAIDTFNLNATIIASRPSLVSTGLFEDPVRTVIAHSLKFPSLVEISLRRTGKPNPWWRWVGGWDILLKFG